jgi:hypothetical protein
MAWTGRHYSQEVDFLMNEKLDKGAGLVNDECSLPILANNPLNTLRINRQR